MEVNFDILFWFVTGSDLFFFLCGALVKTMAESGLKPRKHPDEKVPEQTIEMFLDKKSDENGK